MGSELVIFIGCTFAISWISWGALLWLGSSQILYWLAGFGPTLAALLITISKDGWEGLGRLLKIRSNVSPGWYLFCLFGTPIMMVFALLLNRLLGGGLPTYLDPIHLVTSLDQWPGILLVFLYVLVFSAIGEEIGWRGFLLPRLIKWKSPILASLLLGAIWTVWHLPLFWLPDTIQSQLPITWFLLQILGTSILYTWIYLKTNGSLLTAILLHTSTNVSMGLLPVLPLDNGVSFQPLWITLLFLWITVGLILLLDRNLFLGKFPEGSPLIARSQK